MVVNTQCGTTGTRTTTVTLDASELDGSAYSYLVQDVYSKESVVTNSGASPSFSVELDPGEGKLFRIEPWDDSVTLTGDVTIPSGITLTLDPRATVEFVANSDDTNTENDNDNDGTRSELIVAGTLDASSPGITFRSSNDADDASRNDWYGIHVESGGTADLSGATIRDAHRCVQSHDAPDTTPAPVTMSDATELTHCGLTVSLVPSPPRVGHPVRASVVDPTGTVTGDWQWQRRLNDEEPWEDITLPARTTRQSNPVFPGLSVYTPVLTDMGQMLRVRMHYQDGSDLYNYVHSPESQAVASGRPHAPGGLDPEEGNGHVVLNWNAAVDNGSSC